MYLDGTSPTLQVCTFNDNDSGTYGGGVACIGLANPQIADTNFISNTAAYSGGGIDIDGSFAQLISCGFDGNESENYGGGGISVFQGTASLYDCDVGGNVAAADGGGILQLDGSDSVISYSRIFQNSAAFDGGGISLRYSSRADLENCLMVENTAGWLGGGLSVDPGVGNIYGDPLFVTGPDGNFYLSQVDAGELEDSVCINQGSGPASAICYLTPAGTICLDEMTTRSDQITDSGTVDMGFHYESPFKASLLRAAQQNGI